MEVILLQDVKELGKKGQVVKINDGYARNYVLPKKLGIEANSKNKNDLKLKKAHDEKIAKQQLEKAKELSEKLGKAKLVLSIKTGEGGRTFGSVSSREIAAAVREQLGLEVDKKKVILDDTIKTIGTHIVGIKLHKDVTAKLSVQVKEQ